MNEIKIFNNPEFGQIRTTTDEQGEPLFCLADVCGVLGLRVAAIIWGVAAYKIARKWNSKTVKRLARLRSVRRLLED